MSRLSKLFFIIIALFFSSVTAQTVTGIITDSNGVRLAGLDLQLYGFSRSLTTTSGYDGTFKFDFATGIKTENLPTGYSISNNYPNPFNPKTRIDFSLPKASNIKIEIYNVTGQRVRDVTETNLGAGDQHIDLELNGLPNGLYFARLTIDGNYTVTKKLMLLYGSQHLSAANSSAPMRISKSNKDVLIDSLVISGSYIVKTKINPPPYITGTTLDLGKIKVKKLPDPPYTPCPGLPTISYAGKTYNTVQIGTQCWLKENLDIGVMMQGKQDQTNNNIIEKYCYENDIANCTAYGGLYQWDEAMQYVTTEKAQGICPTGWHIPTKAELYDTLNSFVKGDGNKLKRNDQGTGNGKGTNETGFSALLTGYRNNNDGSFWALGGGIDVWSSTGNNTDIAYFLPLFNSTSYFYQSGHNIALGTSVRCLKDDGNTGTVPAPPTLSLPPDKTTSIGISTTLTWNASSTATNYALQVSTSSTFSTTVFNQSNITGMSQQVSGLSNSTLYYWRVSATNSNGTSDYSTIWSFTTGTSSSCPGTPTVPYSGKTYNTVLIGTQCWLKENLDVGEMIQETQYQSNNQKIEKYCYNNLPANCTTYGGLYQWDEAMQYIKKEKAQGICPPGWHIPTNAELWDTLRASVNNSRDALLAQGQCPTATNSSGFSALLAGIGISSDGSFNYLGGGTHFWSSTESNTSFAYYMYLYGNSNLVYQGGYYKELGFSIRCLKD